MEFHGLQAGDESGQYVNMQGPNRSAQEHGSQQANAGDGEPTHRASTQASARRAGSFWSD